MLENNSADLTIGFDVGGTNVRGGVITREGKILASRTIPTSMDAEQLEADIVGIVDELRADYEVDAVGLALAGFLDPSCEVVRFAPHLPWRHANVRESLSQKLGMHVRLEHDANSAAWGEWCFGAGRGAEDWVFFAVGTGIGATLMTHDTIYRGAFGTAPEFGHIVVVPNGRQCSCGKRGCLERYASGTALPDTCADLRASYETALPTDPTGKEITQAARRGDPLAVAVMEDFSRWLGQGLSIVADVLDPELIVLGGGVSQDADLYLKGAVQAMGQDIVGAGHRPLVRVATAELGSAAGMIGVADLARSGR
ncbi:ROK family protein [Corynebacterium tuberculostearicum]|uniref:ROK family protein n=1 Tax=Corynebacterium tuberculostearicum TaxID=38304 RepID=A0AAE4SWG9_9CORY|nr:ROK family protein [Corynebacterium tuberculostearicum]MDV2419104.1 ROK family protein [Corynebacterium tuberculostearicum]MDV2432091.1 ROK family protein [Corynebacterium tuberculostearicum]WKE57605.1 ROK family protein [Corynebacterium tuberculostearicum]